MERGECDAVNLWNGIGVIFLHLLELIKVRLQYAATFIFRVCAAFYFEE